MVLSRGTLTATWHEPSATRPGELSIASTDDYGGTRGASSMQLSPADLCVQLSAALLWSAYELTT